MNCDRSVLGVSQRESAAALAEPDAEAGRAGPVAAWTGTAAVIGTAGGGATERRAGLGCFAFRCCCGCGVESEVARRETTTGLGVNTGRGGEGRVYGGGGGGAGAVAPGGLIQSGNTGG